MQNVHGRVVIAIPTPAARGMLADKDAIRKPYLDPAPATLVTQLAGRKEAIDFHYLPTAMRHLAFQ